MPSNYINNVTDLDEIYLARVSPKAGDVSYLINGVDISNNYEPYIPGSTKAASTFYNKSSVDLSNIFARKEFKQLNYQYYTVGESSSYYQDNNNGQVYITIINANLNSPGGTHNYTATLFNSAGGVVVTSTVSFTGNTYTFSFIGQKTGGYQINEGFYTITVKDNGTGGLTDSRRSIEVEYDSFVTPVTTVYFTN
jgi:hypothetical protein